MARILEYGDKGEDVEVLQETLASIGYTEVGTPDGQYFQKTQAAVRRFQHDHGIDPTGRATEATQSALEAAKLASINRATDQGGGSRQDAAPAPADHPAPSGDSPQPVAPSAPRMAVVDSAGNVLIDYVKAELVRRAGDLEEVEWYLREAAEAAFPSLRLLTAEASSMNATIAVGLDADLAAIIGASAGAGLYFAANGDWGVYVSAGMDFGAVATASIGIAVMVIDGPPSRLAGDAWAVEASIDIGFGFGGAVMFDSSGAYLGVAFEASLGFGGGIFGSYSNTMLHQLN